MKIKVLIWSISLIVLTAIILGVTGLQVKALNRSECLKVSVPAAITIYSESSLATNIEARLLHGDKIYFCGEANDN